MNEIASTAYAVSRPATAITSPAISGPTVSARLKVSWASAFAAGSRSRATNRGMIALRVGLSTANSADWTATRT